MTIFHLKSLMFFYRELATMINSGMDVISSVDVLHNYSGPSFKKVVSNIKNDLLKGSTLSAALSKFPGEFPAWQVSIVEYSELSGKLKEGLNRIVEYLEKDYEVQKKLILGLAYPVVLLHLAMFMLPLTSLINSGIGVYLYQLSKIIIPFYVVSYLMYILKKFLSFAFKSQYDTFILNMPVLGNLIRSITLTRFIRSLECLYSSGVNIIQSWKTSADFCDNRVIKNSLLKGAPVIERGGTLADAFIQSKSFPKRMLSMIATGEKSGSIDKMLGNMALYCEKEYEMVIGVLVNIMPLFIYVMVGVYIAVKVISFYTSYFSKVLPG